MEISYGPARAGDEDTIFELCKALIYRYEDLSAIDVPEVMNWVREKIRNGLDTYRRIYADGIHAGFCRLEPGEDGMTELDDLYVLPDFQNRGIGTRVIRDALSEAKEPVMLYVFIRNDGACRLYQRLGFEIRKTIGNSRYIMVREKL